MNRKKYKNYKYKSYTKEEKFAYKLQNYIKESKENLEVLNERRRRKIGGSAR